MNEFLDLQHEIPGVPHTAITDIVEQDAAQQPEDWSSEAAPLFGQKGRVALGPYAIGVDYDHSRQPVDEFDEPFTADVPPPEGEPAYAIPSSPKAWLVNVYGSRWVVDAEGATMLQTTPLERLPELHRAIISGILADEHSRPSKLVTNATQEAVGNSYAEDDLRLWLETIHEGFSPIMATGNTLPDGRKEYITHDYTDYHTASNLLWGREMQDRVTKASGYELTRRETAAPELEPRQPNGVRVVDAITCNDRQIDILDYAMHGPGDSPKERMLAAWNVFKGVDYFSSRSEAAYAAAKPIYDKWQAGQYLDPEVAALNIHDLRKPVGELEDFIQWFEHDGARRATDEEMEVALQDALIGITRVAEKVLGIYDGTALELPGAVKPTPGAETTSMPELGIEIAAIESAHIAPAGAKPYVGSAKRGPDIIRYQDDPEEGRKAAEYAKGIFPNSEFSYLGSGRYGVVIADETGKAFKVYRSAAEAYSRYEMEAGALKVLSDAGIAPKLHLFVDAGEGYRLDLKPYDYTGFGFEGVQIPRQNSGKELPVMVMDRVDAGPLKSAEPAKLIEGFCKVAEVFMKENILSWDTEVMVDRNTGDIVVLDVGGLSQKPFDEATAAPQDRLRHDQEILRSVAMDFVLTRYEHQIQSAYQQGGLAAVRDYLTSQLSKS